MGLRQGGPIDRARGETLNNVCTGTILVVMQVTSPIPSKLSVAGRTCFIYYRGQPAPVSAAASLAIKRDCPRSSNRGEHSSTWGSQARSVDPTASTNPPGDPPAASGEQSAATPDGLRPPLGQCAF